MLNEQLKNIFVTAIKNKSCDNKNIKIQVEVSEYLEDKENINANMNFLLDNMQDAVKNINSRYYVRCFGYGTTEDIKEVLCDATIVCGDK